ncbi:MAG: hypothetical protein QF578_21210 [Alphaproteobacteria bacterium]|jgi:hypothetical protein|nr:hypothetical protein [Alphaproteobacteria bacterium]MDP6567362.1 hypothetical protein [Alphaproteobacteria bacterium]MDP6813058.1 hypothetical protein [Alphaproteobacteria bacterium]
MAFNETDDGGGRGLNRKVLVAGAILFLCAALGMFAVYRFVTSEAERDLRQWEVRLGIVAASRTEAVQLWLDEQFGTLAGLAENLSLQLYLTELSLSGGDSSEVTSQSAQAEYLVNLLMLTAEQSGFDAPPQGPEVQANVQRVGIAGLALLGGKGEIIVTTPGMPRWTAACANSSPPPRPASGRSWICTLVPRMRPRWRSCSRSSRSRATARRPIRSAPSWASGWSATICISAWSSRAKR